MLWGGNEISPPTPSNFPPFLMIICISVLQTLVKTTSYTTVSTTTVCYVSTNSALVACKKKKKRSILEKPDTGEMVELTPSKPNKDNLEADLDEFHIDGSEDILLHGEDVSYS